MSLDTESFRTVSSWVFLIVLAGSSLHSLDCFHAVTNKESFAHGRLVVREA